MPRLAGKTAKTRPDESPSARSPRVGCLKRRVLGKIWPRAQPSLGFLDLARRMTWLSGAAPYEGKSFSSRTEPSLLTTVLAVLLAILSGISADIEYGYLESAHLAPPGCWVRYGSDQLLSWRAVAKISSHKFQLCA